MMNNRAQHNLKNSSIFKYCLYGSIALFVLSLCLKMYFSSVYSVKNIELQKISKREEEVQKEISRLSYEDSNLSSLKTIEDRARNLGFIDMQEGVASLNLNTPSQVASLSQR